MLVHPSRATAVHAHFARWAKDIIQQWSDALDQPDHDRTKVETIADFAEAYQDLRATDQNLPAFDIVMAKMKRALNYTQVIEFNARDTPTTPKIEWRHAKGWLLVGGQAVDRGFTVADLTVTYMPRGLGLGNADAIQQRARFFGYKKRYLGQCRIFLTQDTAEAFQGYVGHEEAMRTELERLSKAKAEPLKEWDRRFILADELKPCRDTVLALGDEYVRGSVRSEWTQQKDATLSDEDRLFNAALVDAFLTRHEFVDDNWTFASTRKAQQHKVALEVPIGRVLDFLFEYHFPNALDTLQMTGLLLQLEHVQRWKKDATVMVYSMRPEFRSNTRGRRADADGLFIKGFLQGRTGEGSADGKYPGDAAFSAEDRVTLQLHRLRLLNQAGDLVDDTAPMIAARIPKDVAPNWIVRLEGGAT